MFKLLFVMLAVAASSLAAPEPRPAPGVATVYSSGLGYAAPIGYSAYATPVVHGYSAYAAAPVHTAYTGLGYAAAPAVVYG